MLIIDHLNYEAPDKYLNAVLKAEFLIHSIQKLGESTISELITLFSSQCDSKINSEISQQQDLLDSQILLTEQYEQDIKQMKQNLKCIA